MELIALLGFLIILIWGVIIWSTWSALKAKTFTEFRGWALWAAFLAVFFIGPVVFIIWVILILKWMSFE